MGRTYLKISVALLAFTLGVFVSAFSSRFQWHFKSTGVFPALSTEEKWHCLYEAAGMSGNADMFKAISDRLLCTNRAGVADALLIEIEGRLWCQKPDKTIHEIRLYESSEYGSFYWRIKTSHHSWTLQNLDFVRSINTAKSAKGYVSTHEWPPDK